MMWSSCPLYLTAAAANICPVVWRFFHNTLLMVCICACVFLVPHRGYKIAKPTFHLTIRLEERA
jgi:hypothetical protein